VFSLVTVTLSVLVVCSTSEVVSFVGIGGLPHEMTTMPTHRITRTADDFLLCLVSSSPAFPQNTRRPRPNTTGVAVS